MELFSILNMAQAALPTEVPEEGSNITVLVVVTLIYILAIGYLGFRGYKGTKTTTDFLLAGRNTHPYVMALSYGATFISTSAIIGFGGIAALFGMSVLWLTVLNIFVGIFIAFVFLGKRTRRIGRNLDAHTFPELLGRRFKSKGIQVFTALVIFLIMPLYAAAVLRGGAEFIKTTFDIKIEISIFIFALIIAAYVVAGGLKGVMLTDALQGTIMFVGMVVLLAITYFNVGGIFDGHQALSDMSDKVPASLAGIGHQGWTSMPAFPSPLWNIVITSIVLGVGIGVLAQPQLAVRFMTVKSGKELNRAVLVGGVFILMMTGVAFIVGPLSNVYFMETQGNIAIAVAKGNKDQIIPMYINSALPGWFVVIFMLTLLSAAMSTISSQFHAIGTSIGRDIYEEGLEQKGNMKKSIFVTRLGVIAAFVMTVIIAIALPEEGVVARATAVFFGLCAASFLPMYVGGMYSRRITRGGAIAGMSVGFVVAMFGHLFLNAKNAAAVGLCQKLFSKNCLVESDLKYGMYNSLDPLIYALPLAIIVTVVVSLITKQLDKEHIDYAMENV